MRKRKIGLEIPHRKIYHDKKLIVAVIFSIIAMILLIYSIVKNPEYRECIKDEDCVPAGCCHADSCINQAKKPDCSGIFCTESCQGPLDCNAGYCGCINNQCKVVLNLK